MALNPRFVEPFNAGTGIYANFIANVRSKVPFDRLVFTRRVLTPQRNPPTVWFHVALTAGTSTVTLAFRGDNLYLIGFRPNAAGARWWEFLPGGLIPGSTPLPYDGSYAKLIGDNLGTLSISRTSMVGAATGLAGVTTPAQAGSVTVKKQLALLIVMISEAARFNAVSDPIDGVMRQRGAAAYTVTTMVNKYIHNWSNISEAMVGWLKDPNKKFDTVQALGIKSGPAAAIIVNLLIYFAPAKPGVAAGEGEEEEHCHGDASVPLLDAGGDHVAIDVGDTKPDTASRSALVHGVVVFVVLLAVALVGKVLLLGA